MIAKAGFSVPTPHANTEPFNAMATMLKEDYVWHSNLKDHMSHLTKTEESRQTAKKNLNGLDLELMELKDVIKNMKSIRDDYSPKTLNNNLERVNSRQIARMFSNSRGSFSRETSSPLENAGDDAAEDDIEVKPTNRYPLRKRASAVTFAAKLVRQRKTAIAAIERAEKDKEAQLSINLEAHKKKRRTMTLTEWKERRATQKLQPLDDPALNLVSPYKPNLSASINAFASPAKNNPTKKRSQTFASPSTASASLFTKFDKPPVKNPLLPSSSRNEFGDSAIERVKFKPLNLDKAKIKDASKKQKARNKTNIHALTHSRSSPPLTSDDLPNESSDSETERGSDPVTQPDLSDVFRPLSASSRQFILSSKGFDNFSMTQCKNQPRTPRRLYMQQCREQETFPEPVITRTTKGVRLDGGISLKNYGMGDKQIVALSSALSVMYIKHLDLSGNR